MWRRQEGAWKEEAWRGQRDGGAGASSSWKRSTYASTLGGFFRVLEDEEGMEHDHHWRETDTTVLPLLKLYFIFLIFTNITIHKFSSSFFAIFIKQKKNRISYKKKLEFSFLIRTAQTDSK